MNHICLRTLSEERIVSFSSRWFIKRIDLNGSFRFSGHCSGCRNSTTSTHSSSQDTHNDNKGKDTCSQTCSKGSGNSTSTTTIQTSNSFEASTHLRLVVLESVVQVRNGTSVFYGRVSALVNPLASRLRLDPFTEADVDADTRWRGYVVGVAIIRTWTNKKVLRRNTSVERQVTTDVILNT